MEASGENSAYEYKANVKAKVKKLESSMLNPEADPEVTVRRRSLTAGFKWKKTHRDSLTISKSLDIETVTKCDEKPAVMEVETTQINSNLASDATLNNNVDNSQPKDDDAVPVSVKSLLKKFTNGVASASQPFRRKSLLPSESAVNTVETSSSKITHPIETNNNERTSIQTPKPAPPQMVTKPQEPVEQKSNDKNVETSVAVDKPAPQRTENLVLPNKRSQVLKPIQLDQSDTTLNSDIKKNVSASSTDKLPNTETRQEQKSNALLHKSNLPLQNEKKDSEKESAPPQKSTNKVSPQPKPRRRIAVLPLSTDEDLIDVTDRNNSASILIIGPGRAGKSSMVNKLLRQDLIPIPKQRSSTREILELTAAVSIDSLTDLSTIRVVDIPGYENKDEDASIFSTLISYLDSKTGLQGKTPTAVVIVLRLDTLKNPFHTEEFINFLKVVSHFQKKLFNSQESNCIFVGTFSSTLGDFQSLDTFSNDLSNIIEQNCEISQPKIVFHEIDGKNNDITHNISSIAKTIASICKSKDSKIESAAQMILTAALGDNYPNSLQQCVISKRIPLQKPDHPEVVKVEKALQHIYLNIETTEISTLLEIGWENVDSKLRQSNPSSLLTLQQLCQKSQIRNFSDLPEEPLKVLRLLRQIPRHNLAITDLLMETLQLRIPSCYSALLIGQGYDVSRDTVMHISPFQLSGRLNTSPVGLIPEEVNCKATNDREIIFRFFHTYEDYVLDRMKDLSIKYVTFPTSSLPVTTDQKLGYNIVKPNQEPTKTTTAKALIEYRTFQLSLCGGEDNLMLFKPQFWDTVSSLPDLDMKKQDTIDCWKDFFNHWGTHVVESAFGGGSIQVNFRGKMLSNIFKSLKQDSVLPSDEYETSKVFQWITGDGLDFITTNEESKAEFLQGFDVDTSFQGGDMKFQQIDLTKLSHNKVTEVREEWIQTLPLNPVILETNLVLVPLSYFVREKSEGVATKMDVAFHYFYANFMASQEKQTSCAIL